MTNVSDDEPMRLATAVKIAFPHGGMTVSGLRREHAAGRLEVEMIAGKQFVTLRAIREMRERCRVVPPRRVKLEQGFENRTFPPSVSEQDLAEVEIRNLRRPPLAPNVSAQDILSAKTRKLRGR